MPFVYIFGMCLANLFMSFVAIFLGVNNRGSCRNGFAHGRQFELWCFIIESENCYIEHTLIYAKRSNPVKSCSAVLHSNSRIFRSPLDTALGGS